MERWRVNGSVERIVLVDGAKLADLMIDHEVGVASRAVRIPKIDSDYFEEQTQLSNLALEPTAEQT